MKTLEITQVARLELKGRGDVDFRETGFQINYFLGYSKKQLFVSWSEVGFVNLIPTFERNQDSKWEVFSYQSESINKILNVKNSCVPTLNIVLKDYRQFTKNHSFVMRSFVGSLINPIQY